MLTLATDYSEMFGVRAFPAAVLMYLVSLLIALVVSRRPKNGDWWVAVVWGVVYPVAQTVISAMLGPAERVWLEALPASMVTALLLGWATRSWVAPVGCAVGWGVTASVGPQLVGHTREWWLAVPWNVCVGGSLLVWAVWARAGKVRSLTQTGPVRVVPEGMCAGCGGDVSRVTGGRCPDCGRPVAATAE